MVKRRFTTLLVERDFGNSSLRKAGEAHIRSPFSNAFEPVAQSVEHVTFNHGVVGSNPTGLANKNNGLGEILDKLASKEIQFGSTLEATVREIPTVGEIRCPTCSNGVSA